jgi:hypothetical protein
MFVYSLDRFNKRRFFVLETIFASGFFINLWAKVKYKKSEKDIGNSEEYKFMPFRVNQGGFNDSRYLHRKSDLVSSLSGLQRISQNPECRESRRCKSENNLSLP